jgi:heterodisulfide reductase subunit A-like polyferredoxin
MTGVFACTCAKAFPTKTAASGLKGLTGAGHVESHADLCSAAGRAFIGEKAKKHVIDRVVLAGCPAVARGELAALISKAAGIPSAHVLTVIIRHNADAAGAAPAIRRAVSALEAMPAFQTRRISLAQEVLVIGAGTAGLEAARSLATLGHGVTVIDRSPSAPAEPGFPVLQATTLASLDGVPGAYRVKMRGPAGTVERVFGAMIVATGVEMADPTAKPFVPGKVVPLPGLLDHLAGLRVRELPRFLAIVLDLETDEGRASSAEAYRIAVEAGRKYRAAVALLVRDAKVASLRLGAEYDEAREAGVAIVKYAGRPKVRAFEGGVVVAVRDAVTGADAEMTFDLAAVSPWGLAAPADARLAGVLGLDLDAQSRFQDNNSRLLPSLTNRGGVFAVGACRGENWMPSVLRDARGAALAAHALLAPRRAVVELAHAVVDGDKCVLCLTCVRSCPFKAMRIHATERRADCQAEACRLCGICAGECPNKAIELPAWSDRIVLTLAAPAWGAAEARA